MRIKVSDKTFRWWYQLLRKPVPHRFNVIHKSIIRVEIVFLPIIVGYVLGRVVEIMGIDERLKR